MNKKVSLIGSYNLADGYLGAAESLRRKGFDVDFIPASKYYNENTDKHIDLIKQDLNHQKPDICLWWRAEHISGQELIEFKNEYNCMHILYSWDDPFQWEMHPEMPMKCQALDVAFTCCEGSIEQYEKHGCKAVYCPPGFDPNVHYPDEDDEYKCDVSIVCTNLYHGFDLTKKPHLSRKYVLNQIVKDKDIDLRIYGSDNLKELYPNHYRGWISFNESRKVFHNSKINICTHIRPDGYKYINERVTQILGSKGLLYVDFVYGLETVLEVQKECCLIKPKEITNQIKDILNNYDKYKEIINQGHEKAINNFTWDNWADIISKNIGD